jgi:phosphoribosyl-dephospho-CoA transferase
MPLTTRPRPHDLIRLTSGAVSLADAPAWVRASLACAPWAVVRHDRPLPGQIPVGIRGPRRELRWATYVPQDDIVGIRTPESLRHVDDWVAIPDVAAMRALRALTPALNGGRTAWGPTGSAGFSLATGHIALGEASDLDLLLRCPARPARGWLDGVARLFAGQEARVDCQVETPAGVAHLDDLHHDGPALVRTCAGPRLCVDPWAETGT